MSNDENDEAFHHNLEEEKRYHEKQFKVFKQQKMPMIGGGHGNINSSSIV
jgi:hypothetical protein